MEARAVSVLGMGPPAGVTPSGEISLAYADRLLRRRRMSDDAGRAFLLDLPEPTLLADGAALMLEDGGCIRVRAAPEDLAEIRGADARHLLRLAWHIGNRHLPAQVEAGRLLIQRDHVIEDMAAHLGATVAHVVEPFEPEGGAYGHGRTHGHSHSHDPHADPDAHLRAHSHAGEAE